MRAEVATHGADDRVWRTTYRMAAALGGYL
jgi:hypothetical protein